LQQFVQVLIRQFRDDDQFPADVFYPIHGQQKGVANGFDVLDGAKFFLGAEAVIVQAVEVAIDEFDGLEDAAGGLTLPNFAKSSDPKGSRRR